MTATHLSRGGHPSGRRRGAPLAIVGALKDAVKLVDPEQPIGDLVSLEQLIGRQTAARRFNTTLLGIFALLARQPYWRVLESLMLTRRGLKSSNE